MHMKTKIKKISKSLLIGTSIAAAIVAPTVISQSKITSFAGNREVIPLFYDDTIVTTGQHQSATRYFEGGKFTVKLDGDERTYKNSIFDDDRVTWKGVATAKFEGLSDVTPETITSQVVGYVYGSGRPTFSAGALVAPAAVTGTANVTFNVTNNEKTSNATFKNTSDISHYYDGAATIWKLWSHGQRHVATVQAKNWFVTLESDSDFYSDSKHRDLTQQEKDWKKQVEDFQKEYKKIKEQKEKEAKEKEEKDKRRQKIKETIDEQQDQITLLRQKLETLKLQLELKKLQESNHHNNRRAKRSVHQHQTNKTKTIKNKKKHK